MKHRNHLLSIGIILLFGAITYGYRTNDTVRDLLDEYLIGKDEPKTAAPKQVPLAVYEIADPTDLDDRQYSIPMIDTAHVGRILDLLFSAAGGRYWLTHIDRRSADNPVHYVEVAQRFAAFPAIARNGQNSYSWERTLKEHRTKHAQWQADSLAHEIGFRALRSRFLEDVGSYLRGMVYVQGSYEHRGTDAIGTLNPAFRSLSVEDAQHANERKFIVMFGDGEHNVRTGEKLLERPDNITVAMVNSRPGATKKVITDVVELDHPERVLRLLEHACRPVSSSNTVINNPH